MRPSTAIFLVAVYAAINLTQAGLQEPAAPLLQLSEKSLPSVRLAVLVSNNVVVTGATNILNFQIANHSTNDLLCTDQSLICCLTNASGASCSLIMPIERHLPPGGFNPDASAICFSPVGAGNSVQWFIPRLINERLLPGNYDLEASIVVVQTGTSQGWVLKYAGSIMVTNH